MWCGPVPGEFIVIKRTVRRAPSAFRRRCAEIPHRFEIVSQVRDARRTDASEHRTPRLDLLISIWQSQRNFIPTCLKTLCNAIPWDSTFAFAASKKSVLSTPSRRSSEGST